MAVRCQKKRTGLRYPRRCSGSGRRKSDPNWSSFYYYNVPGSALRPRNSSVEWRSESSGGCLYQYSGDHLNTYNIHLDIPSGARIEYLRIYYYDTNSEDSVVWLTRYDGKGNMEDITDVESDGSNGFGTRLSEYSGHIVNNQSYSYVLNWRPYVNGVTMKLCGCALPTGFRSILHSEPEVNYERESDVYQATYFSFDLARLIEFIPHI